MKNILFSTSLMKMILSSLNLVRKIGVCITSEENGESKLTSEENFKNGGGAGIIATKITISLLFLRLN
jgi:hypothetical protein